ncbi:hypothetical protein AWM70_17265 [Paenibacillus yonginensis]|uniref:Uncharacterized protein n=2 Tax=Paenibacillus TaxID=44249 RepID=A0A1B1N3Y8_9BACL|nr:MULTISPECIES: hypothetical protein [Paenibacillus]ANS76116.1 hypothetical protein AWM70_17265 [Paenibacillus yonginensis]WDH82261.1 hypothetical protein PUW23_22870 [Paenibacillus urinalis]
MTEDTKPIYNQRVKEILKGLSQKIPRDQLAQQFGHKNYKTLDIYMRRKNFTWDQTNRTYVPKVTGSQAKEKVMPTSKAGIVVEMMKEPDYDIERICSAVGFRDNRQLAEYMTSKGYTWSSADRTYKKEFGRVEQHNGPEGKEREVLIEEPTETSRASMAPPVPVQWTDSQDPVTFIQQYEPLLQWLKANQSRISEMIEPTRADTLPRYILPGRATGKTIQMSDSLQDMAVTFCNERNIKQRELFEVALIEFFKKYGYHYEVANLMGSY